jgi:dTDP-4-dehydrorhamnose reductase
MPLSLSLKKNLKGIFNLAGPDSLSRIALFELLLDELGKVAPVDVKVLPCNINDFPLPERRPLNVSLRSVKLLAATGLSLTPMREVCRKAVANALRLERSAAR